MSEHEIGRLIYLVVLLTAIVGWGWSRGRGAMGQQFQYLLIWGFLFMGVIGIYGLWPSLQEVISPRQGISTDGAITLPRARDGHFYITADVNGTPVRFVVDTGASDIVLRQEDARRAGIDTGSLSYLGSAQTANGIVATAPVILDSLSVESMTDRDVRAVVNGGELFDSLLGMSYLNRFESVEIRGDRLILNR
ncbi:TIGR02281 family clan AA aspartic protease [Loktanella sp. IMCC34160]|uniref:retropepsin-like aspartic protease family protein n=1 Tax=Loktanella sp. IMCC34160 TaxID=2510646 RepID=UPI00101B6E45|nr:TIGR02281 family clan AA aspartic protease [Loktanella sp. IMCC34160]RYG89729.1 TIGR02281 family clan AA aspartic protease [Loktanella sp. IMCC34160]